MNYKQLLEAYPKNRFFYLYGKESYFIESFINYGKEQLDPSFRDFNYDLIDLSNCDYNTSQLKLSTVPLMDSHRLVVIKNFSCKESKECIWKKEEKEDLPDFLKTLGSDIKIIIVASSNDKSTKVFKSISSVAIVFESERLDHINLTNHIIEQAKLKGQTIERSLAEYYVNISGYLNKDSEKTISETNSEISKLCSFMNSGGKLTKESIEEMIIKTEDFNIFALIDNSLRGDRTKALSLYQGLIASQTHPIMIFSMLTSSIGLLGKCKFLGEKGMSIDMIAKELKENPYRVKNIVNNGKRFSKKSTIKLLNDLNALDYKYKTGLLTDNVIGHLAIMKITE
ncbi:MAG: DNA polymerase III subunit delta [Filifactoraceae bacterium]